VIPFEFFNDLEQHLSSLNANCQHNSTPTV